LGGVTIAIFAAFGSICAFQYAIRTKSHLWLCSSVAADRVRDRWPPCTPGDNKVSRNALTTFITLGSIVYLFGIIVLFSLEKQGLIQKQTTSIFTIFSLVFLFLVIGFHRQISGRSHVFQPQSVWPQGE
jgi:hypothetical protein